MPRFDPARALRPALRGLVPYTPVEPPAEMAARYSVAPESVVKLDANENPYGASPRALDAIRSVEAHRYPDPDQRRIRAALAIRHHVPEACIVAGAGSDELIDLLF